MIYLCDLMLIPSGIIKLEDIHPINKINSKNYEGYDLNVEKIFKKSKVNSITVNGNIELAWCYISSGDDSSFTIDLSILFSNRLLINNSIYFYNTDKIEVNSNKVCIKISNSVMGERNASIEKMVIERVGRHIDIRIYKKDINAEVALAGINCSPIININNNTLSYMGNPLFIKNVTNLFCTCESPNKKIVRISNSLIFDFCNNCKKEIK